MNCWNSPGVIIAGGEQSLANGVGPHGRWVSDPPGSVEPPNGTAKGAKR